MNNIKLSIIIPCYGVEKYIDRCMKTIVNQTLKDIEIILVDDGSPDNVPHMCDEWAKKDSRIKVIHKENGGLGFARNSGLDIATGEYVAFVDSDDYVDMSMYETLWNEAKSSDADVVFCGFKTEHRNGVWKDSNEVAERTEWNGEDVKGFMFDMIACTPYVKEERKYQMSVWHGIYRRSLIEDNRIRFHSEREVVSEDIPFQVDFLLKANKVVYLPQTFYFYCLNGTSLTATFKIEKYEGFKTLRNYLLQKVAQTDGASQRVNRLFIGYVRSFLSNLLNSKREGKLDIIDNVVNDCVWKELSKEYPSNYLPVYARIIYEQILNKRRFSLFIFIKVFSIIKNRRK